MTTARNDPWWNAPEPLDSYRPGSEGRVAIGACRVPVFAGDLRRSMQRDIIDLQQCMPPSLAQLPGLLREIAEVVGVETALAIAEMQGGTRVHFPVTAGDDHWLVHAAGRAGADKLCRHFRGGNAGVALDVPSAASVRRLHAHQVARDMRAAGVSVRVVALRLGVTERTVYKWTALRKTRSSAVRSRQRAKTAACGHDSVDVSGR